MSRVVLFSLIIILVWSSIACLVAATSPELTATKSQIQTVSRSQTNTKHKILSLGLESDIFAATSATTQFTTAAASVLGGAPSVAMTISRSLSVLRLVGCPCFTPMGERWINQDPGLAWTLLPTISVGDRMGGFYRAAALFFLGLTVLGAAFAVMKRPPEHTNNKNSKPAATEAPPPLLKSPQLPRGSQFIQLFTFAIFPFFGNWLTTAATLMVGTGKPLDIIVGIIPLIVFPILFVYVARKLQDGLKVQDMEVIRITSHFRQAKEEEDLKQKQIPILPKQKRRQSSSDDDDDDDSDEKNKNNTKGETARQKQKATQKRTVPESTSSPKKNKVVYEASSSVECDVVPYYIVPSFIARTEQVVEQQRTTSGRNNTQNSTAKGQSVSHPTTFRAQQFLRTGFSRFFLIGNETWTQDPVDLQRMHGHNKFLFLKQHCPAKIISTSLREKDGSDDSPNEMPSYSIPLLLSMPRIFTQLVGPRRNITAFKNGEVDTFSSKRITWSPFFIIFSAVASILCNSLQGVSMGLDNEQSACRAALWITALTSFTMLCLTFYLRPMIVPFHNVVFCFLELCGFVISVTVLYLTEFYLDVDKFEIPDSVSDTVTAVQLVAVISATAAGFILLVLYVVRVLLLNIGGCQLIPAHLYWKRFGKNSFEQENSEFLRGGDQEEDTPTIMDTTSLLRMIGNNGREEQELNEFYASASASASPTNQEPLLELLGLPEKKKNVVVVKKPKKIVKVPKKNNIPASSKSDVHEM